MKLWVHRRIVLSGVRRIYWLIEWSWVEVTLGRWSKFRSIRFTFYNTSKILPRREQKAVYSVVSVSFSSGTYISITYVILYISTSHVLIFDNININSGETAQLFGGWWRSWIESRLHYVTTHGIILTPQYSYQCNRLVYLLPIFPHTGILY